MEKTGSSMAPDSGLILLIEDEPQMRRFLRITLADFTDARPFSFERAGLADVRDLRWDAAAQLIVAQLQSYQCGEGTQVWDDAA